MNTHGRSMQLLPINQFGHHPVIIFILIATGLCLNSPKLEAATDLVAKKASLETLNNEISTLIAPLAHSSSSTLASEQALEAALEKRHSLMSELANSNPEEFVKHTLSSNQNALIPAYFSHLLEESVTAEGYIATIIEHFDDGRMEVNYFLYDERKLWGHRKRLNIVDETSHIKNGSQVRVRGYEINDGEIILNMENVEVVESTDFYGSIQSAEPTMSLEVLAMPQSTAAVSVAPSLDVGVVIINLLDSQIDMSVETIEDKLFNASDSVAAHYYDSSYGQASMTGRVLAQVTCPYVSGTADRFDCVDFARKEFETDNDLDWGNTNRKAFIFAPGTADTWSAYAYPGGDISVYNTSAITDKLATFPHELGHNNDLGHAWRGTDPYGDKSCVMGNTSAPLRGFHALNRYRLGWLPSIGVQTITSSGTYTLYTASKPSSQTQLLRIANATSEGEDYFISYRTPDGFDAKLYGEYLFSVSIHSGEKATQLHSNLIDSYLLEGGYSFHDEENGIEVEQLYHDSDSVTVQVTLPSMPAENQVPVAAFTSSETDLDYVPATVTFDASQSSDSDGNIVSWSWNFGGNNNASGEVVDYTFSEAGTYQVTLTVTDDKGVTDTSVITITIEVPAENQPPVASFTPSETNLNGVPATVNFDASQSSDSDGDIVTWSWNFGGNNNATGEVISYTFTEAGSYPVTLTVTDDQGATDSSVVTIVIENTVEPEINEQPVADFSAIEKELTEDSASLTFDGSTSTDLDGSIVSWSWNFGNSANVSGKVIDYFFTENGTYLVTLTVTDDKGATNTKSKLITIELKEPADSTDGKGVPTESEKETDSAGSGAGALSLFYLFIMITMIIRPIRALDRIFW